MTELYIDGTRVTLPKELSLSLKHQNPFITKNGEFTLDLELPVDDINNSKLYHHLNRMHANVGIKGRKAVLICDNKVVLNGTEVIVSHTEKTVTVQLVSGNSELNYFIGSDAYISSIDLGKETDLSNERLNQVIKKRFPEVSFTTPMVKIGSKIYNNHREKNTDIISGKPYNFSNVAIQPYLLAMIEKILMALGYTIEYNEVKGDDFLSRIFILSDDQSGEYNKLFPGWKIKDFLEECEKLMNIIFIINGSDRSVRILCASPGADMGTYTINNVLDAFEQTNVDDNPRISYKNVCFDLPGGKEYKYQDIDESILKEATINVSRTYEELIGKWGGKVGHALPEETFEELYKSDKIWYVSETDTYYVPDKITYKFLNSPTGASAIMRYPLKSNTFRKFISNSDDEDMLELGFFPALYTSRENDDMYILTQRMPWLPGNNDNKEEEPKNIRQLIENGVKDFDANKKQVAMCCFYASINGYYFTLTDNVADNDSTISWHEKSYGTFRLGGTEGLVQRYYQSARKIDATKEYTIKFIINTTPDVQARFLLNNKLFICKELEYTVVSEGLHPVATGIFYPVIG